MRAKYQAVVRAILLILAVGAIDLTKIAATIGLGEKTAIGALKSVEGMDKLGPAYLMVRERAAQRVNTLSMGLMLVFIRLAFGYIIWFGAGLEILTLAIMPSLCCCGLLDLGKGAIAPF